MKRVGRGGARLGGIVWLCERHGVRGPGREWHIGWAAPETIFPATPKDETGRPQATCSRAVRFSPQPTPGGDRGRNSYKDTVAGCFIAPLWRRRREHLRLMTVRVGGWGRKSNFQTSRQVRPSRVICLAGGGPGRVERCVVDVAPPQLAAGYKGSVKKCV